MINPEHVIPSHGTFETHGKYLSMAEDTGYELGYTFHIMRNGQELVLP
jgi:ribonuclease J